jgi:hypothetical protein
MSDTTAPGKAKAIRHFAWMLETPAGRASQEGLAGDADALIDVIRRLLLSSRPATRRTA